MKLSELKAPVRALILDIANAGTMDNNLIREIIRSQNLCDNEFMPFTTFDHPCTESYGRRVIYDHGNFKVMLMSWAPGDFTAIHNHGYTEWGCVFFFGEATHRMYDFDGSNLKLKQKDTFSEGYTAPVCGDLIHIMGNSGKTGFTTLHIYGSNNKESDVSEGSTVFLPEFGKMATTMGSAYLNLDKSLMMSEKPFTGINEETLTDYFDLIKPFYERNNRLEMIRNMEHILSGKDAN
ncbi:MAG: cysteine dioxygenase family protein [Bacteroidales bacterium]|nr:cysteine dioxygenase family protein [Bacteroidales bacterium]